MYNKAVDNYAHVLKFVTDCHKTQNMCNKAIDIQFTVCYTIYS